MCRYVKSCWNVFRFKIRFLRPETRALESLSELVRTQITFRIVVNYGGRGREWGRVEIG